jgi:putative transposase
MWTPHPEYLALGTTAKARTAAYRRLFATQLSRQVTEDIRSRLNTGLALGDDRFTREIEVLTGIRQHHLRRGPKS